MDAIMLLVSLAAVVMLFDVVVACMAASEHKQVWQGFKVCKNGAVYNVAAKRFATRQEKRKLFALTDFC